MFWSQKFGDRKDLKRRFHVIPGFQAVLLSFEASHKNYWPVGKKKKDSDFEMSRIISCDCYEGR